MDKRHEVTFEQLENAKDELLRNLEDKDPNVISTRRNNKWSPLEQCYHVLMAEKLSRKYCEKKLSFNPVLKNAGYKNRLKIWALKIIELTPIKFKAPEAINEEVFPENLNLQIVQEEWKNEREELKRFLNQLDDSLVNKEIYKQPSVGRLTIGGMLEFFQFHLDRHRGHIKKDYGIG